MPSASCQHQFRGLDPGVESEHFLAFGVKQQFNGLLKVVQTLVPGLALAIGTRNLQTCRPESAFVGLPMMNKGSESSHIRILALLAEQGQSIFSA